MRADDEGFVGNPKKVQRMIGASDDDYKILLSKRFVLVFESSVMVIKHWLIHNTIRMDRYHPTAYLEEKNSLNVKENKAYTLAENGMATNGLPSGNHLVPQVKLSKDNLSKSNLSETSAHGEFKNVFLTKEEHTNLLTTLGDSATTSLIAELSSYIASSGKKYKSHYATLQNWARRKMQEHQKSIIRKGKGVIL